MVMLIPGIFKSKRHASSSSIWLSITEISKGRSWGSSGAVLGGSRSTMASLLVSLTNNQIFLSNFQRSFLMKLCIVVLECFVQIMTYVVAVCIYSWIERQRLSRQKINLPANQKGYGNSETTDEKLSASRIQIFRVPFSVIIF